MISSSPAEQAEVPVDLRVLLEWHDVFDVVLHADTVRQQSARCGLVTWLGSRPTEPEDRVANSTTQCHMI